MAGTVSPEWNCRGPDISQDYRHREDAMIETVADLDALPAGTVIREVKEGVTWSKESWYWRCIAGFAPGVGQPLFPAQIVNDPT